jgi:hypothetical protein
MMLWALSGCVTSVFFPPDLWVWETGLWDSGLGTEPTGPGPGGPQQGIHVDKVASGCDLDQTSWVTQLRTDGWIHSAKLDVIRLQDQVSEQHDFVLVASDPGGEWDELLVGPLQPGVPAEEQVAGQSSRFRCVEDSPRLSWVVRIWDGAGTLLDCVVWGSDPEGATAAVRAVDPAITELGGCRDFGTPPAP